MADFEVIMEQNVMPQVQEVLAAIRLLTTGVQEEEAKLGSSSGTTAALDNAQRLEVAVRGVYEQMLALGKLGTGTWNTEGLKRVGAAATQVMSQVEALNRAMANSGQAGAFRGQLSSIAGGVQDILASSQQSVLAAQKAAGSIITTPPSQERAQQQRDANGRFISAAQAAENNQPTAALAPFTDPNGTVQALAAKAESARLAAVAAAGNLKNALSPDETGVLKASPEQLNLLQKRAIDTQLASALATSRLSSSSATTPGIQTQAKYETALATAGEKYAAILNVVANSASPLDNAQESLKTQFGLLTEAAGQGAVAMRSAMTGFGSALVRAESLIVSESDAAQREALASTELAAAKRAAAVATENAARASRIQQQLSLGTPGTRAIGGGNTISSTEGGVFAKDGSAVGGLTAVSAAARTAAPLLERQALAQDKANRTLVGSFVHGVTQGGWAGGQGEGNPLGGLLETAGVLTKYALVGRSIQEVSRLNKEAFQDFIQLDKAISLYNQVIGGSNAASNTFVSSLERISQAAGVNVVDALDAATRGVAAFSNESSTASQKQQIGQQFVTAATQNAVITGQKVTPAANDIIAVGTSFGIASQGLTSINDAIATAHSTFGSSTLDISNGLKLLADDGKQAGYSMSELAQVVGLDAARLAESGQEVATNLQRVFAQFQSKAGQSQLQAVGVNTLGTVKTQIEGLAAVYPDLNQKQQQNILNVLGGAKAMKELIPLLSDNTQLQGAFTKALTDQGAGAGLANASLGSLSGQIKVIDEIIKNIGLDIARTGIFTPLILVAGALKPTLQALDSILQLYNKMPDALKAWTAGLLEVGLAFKVLPGILAKTGITGGGAAAGGVGGILRTVTGRGGGSDSGAVLGGDRAINAAMAEWEQASAAEAKQMEIAARARQLDSDETTKSTVTAEQLRTADELLLKATTGVTEALGRLLAVSSGATARSLGGGGLIGGSRGGLFGGGGSVGAAESAAVASGKENLAFRQALIGGRAPFIPNPKSFGESLSDTGKGALTSVSNGIKTGASKISAGLATGLGPVGIAVVGAILVTSAINAASAISQAITASAQLVSQTLYGRTSTTLDQQANDLKAAAAADRRASRGPIASGINALEGNPTGATASIAGAEASALADAAAKLAAIEEKQRNSVNVGDVASTIDLSSATALATSLTTLASTGLSAQAQMDALNRAILRVVTSGGNLAAGHALTPLQGEAAGVNAGAALAASFSGSQQLYLNIKNQNDAVQQFFTSAKKNLSTMATGVGDLAGTVTGHGGNPFGALGKIGRGILGGDTAGAFQQRNDLTDSAQLQSQLTTTLFPGKYQSFSGANSDPRLNQINPKDAAAAAKALKKVDIGALSSQVGTTITAGLQANNGIITPDIEAAITAAGVAQMVAAVPNFGTLKQTVQDHLKAGWTVAIRSQIDTATGANKTAATDAITFAAVAASDATNAQAAGAAAGVKAALSGGNQQLVTAHVALTNMLTDRDALIQLAIASGLDVAQAMGQYNALLDTAKLNAVTAQIQAQSQVTALSIAQLGPFNKTAALAAQAAGDARNAALQAQTITTYSNNGQVPTGTKQVLTVADQTTAQNDANNALQQKIANDQSARLAAIAPGNTVGLATATLRNDQQTLSLIKDKGTKEYTDAYLAVQTDLRAVADAQNQLGTAIAGAYIDPQDPLAAAHVTVRGLINKIATADTKNTLQWFQDQAALAQAQQAVVTAQLAANAVVLSLQTDQTNPATVAKNALIAAQAKQTADNANPRTDQNTKNVNAAAVQSAQWAAQQTQFTQNIDAASTANQLGRVSHQAYLTYLKTQQQQLREQQAGMKVGAEGYFQLTQELNTLGQDILAANNQLVGVFNLGNIKVPTPYEVRRSLATQAVGQQYQTNNNVVINVNGTDYNTVVALLGTYLGPVTTGQYTMSARKVS